MDSTPFSNNPSPALFFLNPSTLFRFHFLSLWPEFLFFTKKIAVRPGAFFFCMSHRRREFFCRANLTYLLKWSPVRHTGGASSLWPPPHLTFFLKRFHPFFSHRGIIPLCFLFVLTLQIHALSLCFTSSGLLRWIHFTFFPRPALCCTSLMPNLTLCLG